MSEKIKRGLIQVYTGNGKGKTTAALGLAMRATGQGLKVGFIQFLKNEPCGEHAFLSRYHAFDILQMSTVDIFTGAEEKLREEAQQTLACSEKEMLSGQYDLLILDEVFIAVGKGLVTIKQLMDLLDKKPESVELVLTGRYAPPEIVQRADLVTEMCLIKHPFYQGVAARCGIEY